MSVEKFDPNRELQVWQRVKEGFRAGDNDIRHLLLTAWESASVYRHLLGILSGKQREKIKRLQEQAIRSVDALKGIQTMSGQSAGNLRPLPIPKEPARRLLEKSFYRCGQLMTEYTARALDPDYAVVYQGLADREREAGLILAELIGSMER